MSATILKRVLILILGIAVIAAVAAVAYHVGMNAPAGPRLGEFQPMRGYRDYGFFWFDPFGLLIAVALGLLAVWLVVGLFRAPSGATSASASTSPDSLASLRDLSEMHDRGSLTDDEFAAAKRKLLGL